MKSYSSINKSHKANYKKFLNNLRFFYKYNELSTSLINKENNNFIIFYSDIKDKIHEFKNITSEAMSYRSSQIRDYLSSGYIVSEINSSLLAEGVHSSRKKVEILIKEIKENKFSSKNNLDKLIINYYKAILFIVQKPQINERNIFTLYNILTTDVEGEIIEESSFYRKKDVFIGHDQGLNPKFISIHMKNLIEFINGEEFQNDIHTKAIISHYIFENIHPYYDFNGRLGRLIHLWILINISTEKFWELIYLSEAIYAFKNKFDWLFSKHLIAKKQNANIDLTFFVYYFYEILIEHSKAYINMKKITNEFPNKPSRFIRLFIIDIICDQGAKGKWYDMRFFKKNYPDYSSAFYGKVLKEIENSHAFDMRNSRPKQFRLKKIWTL